MLELLQLRDLGGDRLDRVVLGHGRDSFDGGDSGSDSSLSEASSRAAPVLVQGQIGDEAELSDAQGHLSRGGAAAAAASGGGVFATQYATQLNMGDASAISCEPGPSFSPWFCL